MKSSLSTIQTLVVAAIGAAAFIIGAYFFYEHIDGQVQTISNSFAQIAQDDLLQHQASDIQIMAKKTASDRQRVDSYILPLSAVPSFVQSLEDLGTSNGVVLKITSLSQSASTVASINVLNVAVTMVGPWKNVYRVAALIQDLPYAVAVDSFTADMNSGTSASKGITWSTTLTFHLLQTAQ
jgi:hypothetical protein